MSVKHIYAVIGDKSFPRAGVPTVAAITADFDYEQVADAVVQCASRHTGPVTNWQWAIDGFAVSTSRDPLLSFVFLGLSKTFVVRMTVWPGPVFIEKSILVTQTSPVGTVLIARTLTPQEARTMTPTEAQEMIGA